MVGADIRVQGTGGPEGGLGGTPVLKAGAKREGGEPKIPEEGLWGRGQREG